MDNLEYYSAETATTTWEGPISVRQSGVPISTKPPMQVVNDYHKEKWEKMEKEVLTKSDGGPTSYYDMPFSEWETTNDMMEHLAEHKWGKYGIHLKDIFKGLCRWGDKSGTTTLYDTKKIVYYGCRVLRMMVGKEGVRHYLLELLEDKQFK